MTPAESRGFRLRRPLPPAVDATIHTAGDTLDYAAGRSAESLIKHHFRWIRRYWVAATFLICAPLLLRFFLPEPIAAAMNLPMFLFGGALFVIGSVASFFLHHKRAEKALLRWAGIAQSLARHEAAQGPGGLRGEGAPPDKRFQP